MKILLAIVVILVVVYVLAQVAMQFSPEKRAERREVKNDVNALRAERERSTLAQNALREIAAGAEMPIFVANDALLNINKTYTKEIQ